MAKQQKELILVTDLPLGTILKFRGTKGAPYRKLYKIEHYPATQSHDGWYSLWGIVMHHTQKADYHNLIEECGMTSNGLDKATHRVVCEGGKYTEHPIQIITPKQQAEGLV